MLLDFGANLVKPFKFLEFKRESFELFLEQVI